MNDWSDMIQFFLLALMAGLLLSDHIIERARIRRKLDALSATQGKLLAILKAKGE